MAREDDARAFAAAMWPGGHFERDTMYSGGGGFEMCLPLADAPLNEHLEFVGRVAEALGVCIRVDWMRCTSPNLCAVVTLDYNHEATASDLSWAALLAAVAAKEAGR